MSTMATVRLTPQQQLHEALLCFSQKELRDQGLATGCAALRQADTSILPSLYVQLLGRLPAACPAARRMHYRLAAYALRSHGVRPWGTGLLQYVRDRVLARVGQEEYGPVAAELADLAAALAAACLDAYARGEWGAFAAAREDMRAEWLSELLLEPLVREACRWVVRAGRVPMPWSSCIGSHRLNLSCRL